MRGAILPLPQYVFMALYLVKHRDTFTFTFYHHHHHHHHSHRHEFRPVIPPSQPQHSGCPFNGHPGRHVLRQVDSQAVVLGYVMSSILLTLFNHSCLYCAIRLHTVRPPTFGRAVNLHYARVQLEVFVTADNAQRNLKDAFEYKSTVKSELGIVSSFVYSTTLYQLDVFYRVER
jgi:hypothetical protein